MPQEQILAKTDFPGHPGQTGFIDQGGPDPGQVAFPHIGKTGKKDIPQGKIENRIAQEFLGLIVTAMLHALKGEGAVHQRKLEKTDITEPIPDPGLQPVKLLRIVLNKGVYCNGHGK